MKFKISILGLNMLFAMPAFVFPQPGNEVSFKKINSKSSGVKFRNSLTETDSDNMLTFTNFYTGSGIGILDVNNDGLQDIYFAGNLVSSRLFLNKGGLKFQDITIKSGVKTDRWITGVSIVDINQDGFDDIYLSVSGNNERSKKGNQLFVNNGDYTFTEKATEYNLKVEEQATHTSFFDYDRDGDLDAFIATNPVDFKLNSMEALPEHKINGEARSTDKLFRNDGNGKFSDVSKESGILIEGYSLGVNTSDFNNDGWIDIYVTNDYITSDILYINNGNGTFTDKMDKYCDYSSFASMGNDAGDINNDGLIDIISVDMLPESSLRQKEIVGTRSYDSYIQMIGLGYLPQFTRNVLQLNNGNNTFSEIGRLAGIDMSDWSWAPLLIDLDNDGYKDLFVTTGFRKDMGNMDFIYKADDSPFKKSVEAVPVAFQLEAIKRFEGIPTMNYVFRNNGDLTFTKVSKEWGFDELNYSSGIASADLDNDGDFDLIINRVDDYAAIYENKTNYLKNHYLKIRLRGSVHNQSGTGSKITIYYNGKLQFLENNPYRGYMSTTEDNVLFGTGNQTLVDSLEVIWPDGLRGVQYKLKVDTTIVLKYADALPANPVKKKILNEPVSFTQITSELGISYKQKEDLYVDFYDQPLLPRQYSKLGPCIAAGDINKDGLEDFFTGGAKGFPGTIFFQKSDGTFRSEVFQFDVDCEDMGALLFDFDNDEDMDLYVVSGGTFAGRDPDLYQDRLYRNTGNGRFEKTLNILPVVNSSGSVVTAADYDRDGDLDLFVGGRISPGNYPKTPASYLLENRNGRFVDITNVKAPGLSSVGMVTSALWSDFTGDGNIDLILVGEWMPVTVFENNDGIFLNRTKEYGLENTTGWWNSIISGNFNDDNRIDYMLGNLGLNNPYHSTVSEPLKLVSKDFDNDGKLEPIMIMKYIDGYFPIASRSQFLFSFPYMAKKYDTYEAYAKTNAEALIKDLGKEGSNTLEAKVLANALLYGPGDSNTVLLKPLPTSGQLSPIFGSCVIDFDGDKISDVICVGNLYSNNINDGPYNASTGTLIKWDSVKNMKISRGHEIGFYIHSDARAMASLVLANQKRVYLVACNSDSLKVFMPVINKEQHIKLKSLDAFAIIDWGNGLLQKEEFYYGSGYLSQSSRYLSLLPGWKKVKVITYAGQERIITPNDLLKPFVRY